MLDVDEPRRAPFSLSFSLTASLASKTNWPAKSSTSGVNYSHPRPPGHNSPAIFHPDLIVFLAMSRGDVDASGSRFQRDEGGEDEKALAIDEGMTALEPFHHTPGNSSRIT
jgi:hypothetical protein